MNPLLRSLLSATAFLSAINCASAAPGKPNVLLIAVDDLNDWIGALHGHPQSRTPNMDRLAARGFLFTNAHSQGTMCNPSRISVLWGLRPSSTGFYDNHYPVAKEPEFLRTHRNLPSHFAANGYRTLSAGKVFHTSGHKPDVQGPQPGQWVPTDKKIQEKPAQIHSIWDFGPQGYDETKFADHLIATWAAVELSRPHPKPFFLSLGFYRPHVPFFPPKRIYDSLGEVSLPEVPPDDWDDIPAAARKLTLSNPAIPTHDWMLRENRWKLATQAYLACIRWTDEQIGRVIDALDNGPNASNTIVILFSDHGYHLGEKQRWSKFSLWERSTRVPLIVSIPKTQGTTAPQFQGTSGEPVELLSIFPTLIDLCGLPGNPGLEGVSLRPLLEKSPEPWNHVAISTLGQGNHAVRDRRWRYIRYANGSEELYDHRTDPNEWTNLAFGNPTPEHLEIIQRLKSHLPETNLPQRSVGSR